MSARLIFAAALGLSVGASAQNAQDELERQLKDLVGKPPTKLLIEYEGLDQPNYKLVDITFDLDGSSLPSPSLEKLNSEGKHLIFHGDIKPGKHTLETTVVLTDVAGVLFSYEAGFKWKVKNSRSFEQAPGLEVHVIVTPDMNPGEKDPKKKFVLKSTAVPKMLAKLEDGTMPDSPKPNLAAPKEEPDAGVAVAAAEPSAAEKAEILKEEQAEAARLKKQQAMEDARRKKEDAAAAAEEKKRLRAEAAAAKKAAAEDKKRQKAEAAAAAKAAAEDKKRQKSDAVVVAKSPDEKQPVDKQPVEAAPQPEAAPSEPVAEAVDAGAPVIAAAETPKPAQPKQPEPEPESGGFPLPIIIGLGVALLGIIIFVATRKKSPPPQY